ncbi:alkaline shock response membrane anchor protein AmaP [Actinophytocola oryzae]|uniref:Uncharacterized protein n=1 Tax=Actinophytocola oryzae TaxID=502181 RepID=A0A4R7VHC5_9PSEU|nr:alkaline shock response membrane anchor protein AmaP [Actinophytocola oryzae]TDV48743.1 hypothetical protein CLV71_108103 [Actinophytocola oryzae]
MSGLNRPAGLNRVVLAVVGAALVAGGGLAATASLGRLSVDPATPLAPGVDLPPTWVLYVIAAGAVVLGLLCLRWLAAQPARKPRTRTWRLADDPEHGRTELAARIATAPFTADVGTYPGVHKAHADLTGPRHTPTLAVIITTEQGADLTDIRDRLDTHGLPRLRNALDLTSLRVTLEFRFTTKAGARTA